MKLRYPYPVLFIVFLGVGGCSQQPESEFADMVLYNGKIVTVDGADTVAGGLAIKGDRIIAVGSDDAVLALRNDASDAIDLGGRTVIPGLIDSHVHALGFGLHTTEHVMFSTGERLSIQAMLDKIANRAAEVPDGKWIYVRGPYSLDFIDEGRLPNRYELDTVTPDNPVFINTQGHIGVVNSKAIEVAGVDDSIQDPENGIYMRDPDTGKLTGTMYEFPAFTPFLRMIPPYSFEVRVTAARAANEAFNKFGISTVVNLWAERETIAVLKHLQSLGELTVRWSNVYRLSPGEFDGKSYAEIESIIREVADTTRANDDWVRVDGVKIIYDGFAEAAYMHDPYLEDRFGAGWHGVAFWDLDTIKDIMRACLDHDVQVFVHVAGDKALDDILDAMEAVDEGGRIAGRRWTLEHASTEPTTRNLKQVQAMQLLVSTQQAMGWSIGKTFKQTWGAERGATFAPNKTWLDGLGHPYVKGGSDNRPINPFIGIWSYLVRQDVDGAVSRPDQVLSLDDTLRLYTANGAFGLFAEDEIGSIEVGKFADLVVLSEDILSVPVDRIQHIKPYMSIVGGKTQYSYGE